jgi:hypothetical protein
MRIGRNRALVLTFIGLSVVTVAIGLLLGALDASGTVRGLAIVFISGGGGFILSLVVMHSEPPEPRLRRERHKRPRTG